LFLYNALPELRTNYYPVIACVGDIHAIHELVRLDFVVDVLPVAKLLVVLGIVRFYVLGL
jgi:hypothetical protein